MSMDSETDEKSGGKAPRTPGRQAVRSLRAARREREAAAWHPEPQSDHLLAEAEVLALLELADAIRGSQAHS